MRRGFRSNWKGQSLAISSSVLPPSVYRLGALHELSTGDPSNSLAFLVLFDISLTFISACQPFDILEKEMLNGQKLQGVETAKELHAFLQARGKVEDYPLFTVVVSSLVSPRL